MNKILEAQVNWAVLSSPTRIELEVDPQHFPLWLRLYSTEGTTQYDLHFEEPPLLIPKNIPPGHYYCELKNERKFITTTIIQIH